MDELQEFFHDAPQGEEHPTSIKIGALGPAHRMLAKNYFAQSMAGYQAQ
jgi:hypothetical protein